MVALSLRWYLDQQTIFVEGEALSLVTGFYAYVALGICLAVAGAWSMSRGLVRKTGGPVGSVWTVISETLASSKDVRVGAIGGALYGVAYLFVSSILVYQPSVDFASAYGVTTPSAAAAACCGSPGAIPELVVYLIPRWHLALQILPMDALFAVVVPILVGFNLAVATHALRNRVLWSRAGWLGPVGVMAGLFTGCPTCAGLFLAGTVGGLGATTLAVVLAPYQMLFVALSIPLLVVSPFVVAVYAGRAAVAACAVPGAMKTTPATKNP